MTHKSIAIITDSTCDVPQSLLDEYAITVINHVIIWGEQQYRDRADMTGEVFYRRLIMDPVMPTTSQASVVDFAAAYRQVCEAGAKEILVVSVGSGLSGAIRSAQQAAEESPVPVTVHDSRGATMSLGWQVIAAARARETGGDVADMVKAAELVRDRVQLYILLDTLEYVYRGGRIGNARRLVGAMLNIKPLIYVDHSTSIVEPGGMAMTRRRGLDMLCQKYFALMDTSRPQRVAVMHGDAFDDAAMLYDKVERQYHPVEMYTGITTPTLGIHTGPQAIALAGYWE